MFAFTFTSQLARHRQSLAIAVAFFLGGSGAAVFAAGDGPVPMLVPYTGHLDENGTAVDGVARSMTFRIFDDVTAGTQLASDAFSVTPAAGLFSVVLGGGADPLVSDEADRAELWLEVEIEGVVIGARQQIFGAMQAVRADRAQVAALADVASTVDLAAGDCMNVAQDAAKEFEVCGNNGVHIRPTVASTGDALLRVTNEADTVERLRVDENGTFISATDGLRVDDTTGTDFGSIDADQLTLSNGSAGSAEDSMEVTSTAITATINGATGPVTMSGTVINGTSPLGAPTNSELTSMSLTEENGADKLFEASNDCIINSLFVGRCGSGAGSLQQACICTCQNVPDEDGRGWYCWN